MKMRFDRFLDGTGQVVPIISSRKATGEIRKRHAVRVFGVAHVDVNGVEHGGVPVSVHELLDAQASLLQDAVDRGQWQVLFGMRHGDFARLGGMLELVMRTHHVYQLPAIGFHALDDVGAFHGIIVV